MNNPNGPYPGRQLFLGLTVDGDPCLAYLVTGRSPQSRERIAVPIKNRVRIGPIDNAEYDPLRHYLAVEYDNNTGIAVVSNGIQTEAIFETYRLLHNTQSMPNPDYMGKLLDGAGAEPDSYRTPRIAGTITSRTNGDNPVYVIGIKLYDQPAKIFQLEPKRGTMIGIPTYGGDLDNPEPFNPNSSLPKLELKAGTAKELAQYLFDLSNVSYKGDDIRVCSVGGTYSRTIHMWELAVVNKLQKKG